MIAFSPQKGCGSKRIPLKVVFAGFLPLLCMLVMAFCGPFWLTVSPLTQDLMSAYAPPFGEYLLGADHLGRSIAARLVEGARASLGLSFAGVAVSAISGSLLGVLVACYGGGLRSMVMGLANVIIACPTLLFVIMVTGLFDGGVGSIFFGIWMSQWPSFTRLVSAVAARELSSDHVEASRLLGFSNIYIIRRHVLPSVLPYLYSLAALSLGTNVLTISSVGFLGIGLRPPNPEWGAMIAETMSLARTIPHMVLAPALAILICTLSATIIGEYFGALHQNTEEETQ